MMWKHAVLIPPLSLGFVKPGVPAWSAVPGDPWERNRRAFSPLLLYLIYFSLYGILANKSTAQYWSGPFPFPLHSLCFAQV